MSRLSIYANSWINLVFEGKNQAYGAFQLRQKSDETTLLAFCLGISLVAMVATIPMLVSSFSNAPQTVVVDSVYDFPQLHITKLKIPPPKTPAKLALPVAKKTDDATKKKVLINPTVVPSEDAHQDIAKPDEHPVSNNQNTGANPTTGSKPDTGTTPTGTTQPTATLPIPDDILNTTVTVDKVPEFPGGINAFYGYIGENFEKLEVEETISVVVSFVVEKDGSMTDIKVLRSAAPSIDREAIRVLKSLRTKWKPGLKNGKPVRTEYKLPIKVKK